MKLTEVKKQLNLLNEYFVNKLIKGQFKVVEIKEHTMSISIDGSFVFNFWVANKAYSLELYSMSFIEAANSINLSLNEKEKNQIWSKLNYYIKKYKVDVVLKQKQEQFEQLKKELNY